MIKFIIPAAAAASITFSSCGGSAEAEDGEKESEALELCDCIDTEGSVQQTKECRQLAGNAKAPEIEACMEAKGGSLEDEEYVEETSETEVTEISPDVQAMLDKFENMDDFYSIKYDEESYTVAPEGGQDLTSKEQVEIMGMGGYDNEEGFGMHLTALKKVKISDTKYVLIYTSLMVPVPAVYDEVGLSVFDVEKGVIKSMSLAYLRGAVGEGTQIMTATVGMEEDHLMINQTLRDETEIDTEDGPMEGPTYIYDILTKVMPDGTIKEIGKQKVGEEIPE